MEIKRRNKGGNGKEKGRERSQREGTGVKEG
jgi:hypothetical protein